MSKANPKSNQVKTKTIRRAGIFHQRKNVRKRHPQGKGGSIKEPIKIDRTHICEVDKAKLPDDAEFKGYETATVQDLKIETDNIEFHKEIYYSPSERKTYRGELPLGYEGGFGPTVKALSLIMKNICNVSEPKIGEILHNLNIRISSGSISNILIKKKGIFHQEKEDIVAAGLLSTPISKLMTRGLGFMVKIIIPISCVIPGIPPILPRKRKTD